MWKKESSLKEKIWSYLIIFSCLILISLWLFQVAFLNRYYEWSKGRSLSHIADELVDAYNPETLETTLDDLSYERGVCVQIIKSGSTAYGSDRFNRGCMSMNGKDYQALKTSPSEFDLFKTEFMSGTAKKKSITLVNPRFGNKTLIYGIRLDKEVYAFVSASLEPLDATTKILASQLIFVTIGVLILSFIVGYVISKKISKPIIKINDATKRMAKGEYDAVFETGENIKELNELADTLNQTSNELAKTDELRRDLLANVSHDLKTPLTMIRAYAEMVRDLTYQDEVKRTENLNVIIDETDRLNLLVNDILELSKMQSNIETLEIETFDITKMVNTIVSRFQILTETENYKFIIKGKKSKFVKGDPKKVEQVIYNLIGNAISYTGKDKKITIEIKELENVVRVNISDTGSGIEPEELDKIWDKYYKSDKKHKRNTYGTGIGLSIVKQVLESHHAKYGVISKIGKGTTFYFELEKDTQKGD